MTSGKLCVALLVGLALLAAATSWLYRRESMARVVEFWGPETAELLARSETVEVLRLRASTAADPPISPLLDAGRDRFVILERRNMSRAAGLVHLRQALLEDRSYAWDQRPAAAPTWDTALVLRGANRSATLLISLADGCVIQAGKARIASIAPILHGLRTIFDEQFAQR